jgi:ribosomal protein S18 acetylase RimI-like enzyme
VIAEMSTHMVMPAEPKDLPRLAKVFGHAFVTEPMMRWPMGAAEDQARRFTQVFHVFLEEALEAGVVWTIDGGAGAAVWTPPGLPGEGRLHPWDQPAIRELADDGGPRYQAFWDWVYSRTPKDLWQLDSIAVDPTEQGHGLGSALVTAGLDQCRASGVGAFLSTDTPANVDFYERCGFHSVGVGTSPGGGPTTWFMSWEL